LAYICFKELIESFSSLDLNLLTVGTYSLDQQWYNLLLNPLRVAFEDVESVSEYIRLLRGLIFLGEQDLNSLAFAQILIQCQPLQLLIWLNNEI
jgi:hypothetical protein